jgi:hypothetical protein
MPPPTTAMGSLVREGTLPYAIIPASTPVSGAAGTAVVFWYPERCQLAIDRAPAVVGDASVNGRPDVLGDTHLINLLGGADIAKSATSS